MRRGVTFMRTHRLASGRLMVFKRLKSGACFLMVNGRIKASVDAGDAQKSVKPWRIAQVFNSMTRWDESRAPRRSQELAA